MSRLKLFQQISKRNITGRNKEASSFITQLNNWFPNLLQFNQKFVKFLRQNELTDEDFERILDKEHFVTSTKIYLKEFSSVNQLDYLNGLRKQIEDILVTFYGFDPTVIDTNSIFTANFTVSSDYFYDKYVIKSKIDPIVSQLKRQQSFIKLNDTLAFWYPTSINLNSIVVNFLMLKNIENEVIGDISENHEKFNEYLLNHVYEISRAHKVDVENEIYGQIKMILMEDYRELEMSHQNIINELRKNKKMANSYWLNLIYDRQLLRKLIKYPLRKILQEI